MGFPTDRMVAYALDIAKVSPESLSPLILKDFEATSSYISRNKHYLDEQQQQFEVNTAYVKEGEYEAPKDNRTLWQKLLTFRMLIVWLLLIGAMALSEWEKSIVILLSLLGVLLHWISFKAESVPTWFVVNASLWKSMLPIQVVIICLAVIAWALMFHIGAKMLTLITLAVLYFQWQFFKIEITPPLYLIKRNKFWQSLLPLRMIVTWFVFISMMAYSNWDSYLIVGLLLMGGVLQFATYHIENEDSFFTPCSDCDFFESEIPYTSPSKSDSLSQIIFGE